MSGRMRSPCPALALLALVAGACVPEPEGVPCGPGTTSCGAACYDLASDPIHCGSCTIQCDAREVCTDGACACAAGLTSCAGDCVELGTSLHCAGCGDACPADRRLCVAGACTPCGGESDPCCEGGSCAAPDAACVDGTCVGCGRRGEPCCQGGACEPSFECTSSGECDVCGGLGEPCCAGSLCERPVAHVCDPTSGTCEQRNCIAVETEGLAGPSPPGDHCSAETYECVNTSFRAPPCLLGDDTPPRGGYDCAACALHEWLQCSIGDGCALEASTLLCCIQSRCVDPRWTCSECLEEDDALVSCNERHSRLCDRIYSGSAIARCF